MTEDEFIGRLRCLLEPPAAPPAATYEEMIAQLRRSAGNLGSLSPAIPVSWRSAENAVGGHEHWVIIPRPL